MLISRTWLQSYFENEIPDAPIIAETLLLHSFEIEGIHERNGESIIDIDVLPNRAHDCLSYEGIAREYAMLSGLKLKENHFKGLEGLQQTEPTVSVEVHVPECYRYMAQAVSGIQVANSPQWMQNYLSFMDQKSINNVVDATNIIMFETGQPLHAFDADKVVGGIIVRNAQDGETMTTLTGEEISLTPSDVVIADHEGVLALAGVKGGTKAEVTLETENIIIEAANFNSLSTRITSRRVKILTDSSKRFENGISSELSSHAIPRIVSLITEVAGTSSTTFSPLSDHYPQIESPAKIKVPHQKIELLLGITLPTQEVQNILTGLDCKHTFENEMYTISVPYYRLDLSIPEDIIEEIGRIYGYHNIPTRSLDDVDFSPRVNTLVLVENGIKNFLTKRGFNEIKNYAFVNKGEIELYNPLASDKKALRSTIERSFTEALEKNSARADYYGVDRTLVFEISRIYHDDGEETMAIIGIRNRDKKAKKEYGSEEEQLRMIIEELENDLGVKLQATIDTTTAQFSLSTLELRNETLEYGEVFSSKSYAQDARFHSVSPYPYTTRDVSFWTDKENAEDRYKDMIQRVETLYLKKIYLFDTFQKDGKNSYAYSLIFQSNDKTLTDKEVEEDMQKIITTLENNGCELR